MFWIKFLPILLIAIGFLNMIFPRTGLFWSFGRNDKNAGPSEASFLMARIGGVLALGIGVFLLITV